MAENASYLDVVDTFLGYTNSTATSSADYYGGTAQVMRPIGEPIDSNKFMTHFWDARELEAGRCEYCGMPVKRCGCGRYR